MRRQANQWRRSVNPVSRSTPWGEGDDDGGDAKASTSTIAGLSRLLPAAIRSLAVGVVRSLAMEVAR